MNTAVYEFHDQIPRLKRVWRKSPRTADIPFDYVTQQLSTALYSGTANVTDLVDETVVNQDFNSAPKYLFVDRKLSEFLDKMHINGVPSDYIRKTCERLEGTFMLVWGDGSTNLCDVSFLARMRRRRVETAAVLKRVSGHNIEWFGNEDGVSFRLYSAIDSKKDAAEVLGVRIEPTIIKKIRDIDIEPLTRKDYDLADRKMEGLFYSGLDTEEEGTINLALTRLIKTLVYIASYPENLKDGIVGDCAFAGLQPKHISRSSRTMTIKTEHRDISSHVRRQFFRLYPLRRNGERTPGLVFVKSTVVKGSAKTATSNS